MSHADKCILSQHCSLANGPKCNALCGSYIALHGHNGAGGRTATAGVPADYRKVTLQNSPARGEQPEAYALIDKYVTTFKRQFDADGERIKSLYLYSDSPGTGKTTSAAAVLNDYNVRHFIGSLQRNRQPLERPSYFLDLNAWQTDYNLAVMMDDAEQMRQVQAVMKLATYTPFVVLDDIGVRSASEGFRAMLHAIVNYRVANALPTVYTSNVKPDELKTIFDRRLADRVRDMCMLIEFKGASKRGFRRSAS
ncbi:DNA replication protein [Neobacillus mesonae]|nr:DNA replication protein [Neobacillus mesonae]